MVREKYPSDKQDQFMIRMPDGMRDRIAESAAKNSRSMNAEIVARLEASYEDATEKDEQIAWLQDYLEGQTQERAGLFEALNNQDRILQRLNESHRTLAILAKSLGEAFLTQGDRSDLLKVLATGLIDVEVDLSSDASEPIPKKAWEY